MGSSGGVLCKWQGTIGYYKMRGSFNYLNDIFPRRSLLHATAYHPHCLQIQEAKHETLSNNVKREGIVRSSCRKLGPAVNTLHQ